MFTIVDPGVKQCFRWCSPQRAVVHPGGGSWQEVWEVGRWKNIKTKKLSKKIFKQNTIILAKTDRSQPRTCHGPKSPKERLLIFLLTSQLVSLTSLLMLNRQNTNTPPGSNPLQTTSPADFPPTATLENKSLHCGDLLHDGGHVFRTHLVQQALHLLKLHKRPFSQYATGQPVVEQNVNTQLNTFQKDTAQPGGIPRTRSSRMTSSSTSSTLLGLGLPECATCPRLAFHRLHLGLSLAAHTVGVGRRRPEICEHRDSRLLRLHAPPHGSRRPPSGRKKTRKLGTAGHPRKRHAVSIVPRPPRTQCNRASAKPRLFARSLARTAARCWDHSTHSPQGHGRVGSDLHLSAHSCSNWCSRWNPCGSPTLPSVDTGDPTIHR